MSVTFKSLCAIVSSSLTPSNRGTIVSSSLTPGNHPTIVSSSLTPSNRRSAVLLGFITMALPFLEFHTDESYRICFSHSFAYISNVVVFFNFSLSFPLHGCATH